MLLELLVEIDHDLHEVNNRILDFDRIRRLVAMDLRVRHNILIGDFSNL